MKITLSKAALVLAALISMAACSSKPQVIVQSTDEPTTEVEVTAPAATQPETTDVPFTLPVPKTVPAPEVTEPELTAPPVINPGFDPANDRILSDEEYAIVVQVLTSQGYNYASQATTEALGAAMCDLAEISATGDDFAQTAYDLILANDLDPDEMGFAIGVITATMCQSEMVRLGF